MAEQKQDRTPLLTDEQISRAKAVDLVKLVSLRVKLKRVGSAGDFVGSCPFHEDGTPSFRVSRHRYHCFGCDKHGDVIAWVREFENLDFVEAVHRLNGEIHDVDRKHIRIVARTEKPRNLMTNPKVREARAIFQSGQPAAGSPIEADYFPARKLPIPAPPSIKFMPNYPWRAGVNITVTAMLVAVQSLDGRIIGLEATALSEDCRGKAFGKNSRDKRGEMSTGAARFAAATDILGIAEGAETAIAAMHLTGVPTWASLSAGRMHSVAIPDTVRELHIFADDDEPGHMAAERTAAAHPSMKKIIRLPPEGYGDWNDLLMGKKST